MTSMIKYQRRMDRCLNAMDKISLKTHPTTEDRQTFDELELQVQELRRVIDGGDPVSRGISPQQQRKAIKSYKGDKRTTGGKYELLRPDQSISGWAAKRGFGASQGSERDLNAFWAQRMGVESHRSNRGPWARTPRQASVPLRRSCRSSGPPGLWTSSGRCWCSTTQASPRFRWSTNY
jgi:hypothetical protein